MISIGHLTRRYRNITAVDGLSLEAGPGRVTGFRSHGAGKTITLRTLLGLARPDGGTATINGARAPATAGRRPRCLYGRVADRRLAGRAAPGRDLTHPPRPAVAPCAERRR
jgi:ABC-type multidrug transport system ATPase subunit